MSYQFSFLQAFAGYYFVESQLLTALVRNKLLKSLQADLQVEFYRQPQIMLLADIGKYRTRICYRLRCFRQMSLYWTVLDYATLTYRWLYPTIYRLKNLNKLYFWQLKQFLTQSSSDCDDSYIFDNHIVTWLCKHLLQIGLSKNKKISDLQLNFNQNISVV